MILRTNPQVDMRIWTENVVRPIRDELLVRSAREFRQLIDYLDSTKPSCQGRYLQEVRRGLRLMKEELARRGLEADTLVQGAPPRYAAPSGAEPGLEVTARQESGNWRELFVASAPAPSGQRDRSEDASPKKRETSGSRPAVPPQRHRGA